MLDLNFKGQAAVILQRVQTTDGEMWMQQRDTTKGEAANYLQSIKGFVPWDKKFEIYLKVDGRGETAELQWYQGWDKNLC